MRIPFLAVIALVALAGCAGPPAPPDHFHRVEPAAPSARFARPILAGALEVERLAADGALSERAVTFAAQAGGPLSHYKYDYWSEPPALILQDRLADYLTKAGIADRVVTPDLRVLADWTVRGKLRRFEQIAGSGRAVIAVQLAVVSARDGRLVLLEEYSADLPLASEKVEVLASAMEKGVSDIFARFLADLGRAAKS